MGLLAFPLVFMSGCALMLSRQRTSQVAGVFLGLGGLAGTSGMGPGSDGFGAAIVLLVVGLMVCLPIAHRLRSNANDTELPIGLIKCPNCGRLNGPEATICPRCYKHLTSGLES